MAPESAVNAAPNLAAPAQADLRPADIRLAAVSEVARALSAPWTADELLDLVMDRLTWALDADRSTLFLVDGDALWSKITRGGDVGQFRVPVGVGVVGWVAQRRRGVNIKNAYDDPRFDPSWDKVTGYTTRSLLCQPVLDREENLVGVVQVLNKRGGYFHVDDERLLSTILSMTAISIVNAHLAEQLATKNDELLKTQGDLADRVREIDMLYDLEREVARAPSFDGAVRAVVERVSYTLHADLLQVAVRTEGGGLVLYRALGPDFFEVLPLPKARGLVARVFDEPKRYNPCDMPKRELQQLAAEEQLPWVPAAGLCVPLERDDGLVGALAVYWKPGRHACMTEDQVRVVELTADQIGHALAQRQARQRQEREERLSAIGSALASIVHDLKTPMTVASGYVQLLKLEDDQAERASLADGVLEQLRRMTDMTREVLGFARGDNELLVVKVVMPDFAKELERLFGQVFADSQIRFGVECLDRGYARIDAGRVMRAVQNIARNARDALGDGREHRFDVKIQSDGADLVITCSDDGPGVPRDFQHRLFEAFATHGKADGTGLGLAMVKQTADLHGGTVVYRETPGGGATFELRLPRDARGGRGTAPVAPAGQ